MSKVLVLGGTGMLGHVVADRLKELGHDVVITVRNHVDAIEDVAVRTWVQKHKWMIFRVKQNAPWSGHLDRLHEFDYVINCIGIIKPYMAEDPGLAITVNSLFPIQLGYACRARDVKLIHVTTDCVYDGKRGNYFEEEPHNALDAYGKSKSLGEPITQAMVLRTSIIGPELHSFVSLTEWVRKQDNREIDGYLNHLWTGVTTKEFANICHRIMSQNLWSIGLQHVFSDPVTKYHLVLALAKKYNVNVRIKAVDGPESCNRSLSTQYPIDLGGLQIQPLADQIDQM